MPISCPNAPTPPFSPPSIHPFPSLYNNATTLLFASLTPLWLVFVGGCCALLDAYESSGWRRSNEEKIKPTQELADARRRIRVHKAKLRRVIAGIRNVQY